MRPENASPGNPKLERLARVGGAALMVSAPFVLLAVIAGVIGYVRLSHGPISLKMFAPHIERSISAEFAHLSARIDDATVGWADGGGLEFHLINLSLREPDGDLVASAPLAAVELSRTALLMLRVVPERVYLIEPRISLTYTEESGLALSFSQEAASGERNDTVAGAAPSPALAEKGAGAGAVAEKQAQGDLSLPVSLHRIDLARVIAESSARARSGVDATSKLREIGLRNATVIFEHGGKSSEWKVSEAAMDLEHMKRHSVISGAARISSSRGPWTLSFRTEDSKKKNFVKVAISVRDLVPASLAKTAPQLSLLQMLDMPITGDVSLDISAVGELKEARLALELSRGKVYLPSLSTAPLTVDAGRFELDYDAAKRHLKIAPSTLTWGDSHMTLEGALTGEMGSAGDQEWHFGIKANEGVLAAEEFGVAGVAVDVFAASGRLVPAMGLVQLSEFRLEAGGAKVSIAGEITTGGDVPSTRVEAVMSPMTLPTLKALWPRAVASGARTWVGKHLTRGNLQSGSFKLLSGNFLKGQEAAAGETERLSLAIEASDLQIVPLPDGLPVEAPRALIRLENNAFEVTIPDAAIIASPTRQVPLKAGRFTIVDVGSAAPVGELAFRTQTPLAALLDAVNRSHLPFAGLAVVPVEGVEGKVDGEFKITMPLGTGGAAVKTEGKARITDIRSKSRIGSFELHGGTIDVDVTETAIIASGEMLLNGVLMKLDLQHILDAPDDTQLPLRLTARLDNSDRTELGLDVNHLVQGEVPVEVSVTRGTNGVPQVHAHADLTNAELIFHHIAWRKPQGRAASLDFDIVKSATENLELRNFKVSGDNIAIEGWLSIDAENEVREFFFPDFSLNVVSRLEVRGKLSSDRIWSIKARGATYDGKDLFRTLLALGQPGEAEIKPRRPAAGLDIQAEIDTVLGHSNVALRGFNLKLSERRDQLATLEARGTLDGNMALAILLKKDTSGARVIYADSTDAGQVFKLVGFYPNMQGGRVRLEVNLDGRGAAEKTGILWVDDFRVLGDPVVSEVYSSVGASGPAIDATPQGERRVVREVFEFDHMKAPFSVGHGQFVLEDSYVKGPMLGASIRGKVDYSAQRVNLGGTYVPLQGINSALCDIPLFGPIVAGLKCEGVFGITYAIQGPMAEPQVIVNPLSMFTPGILRGIMEMTNPDPKVQPRADRLKAPVESRVRASSSGVVGAEGSREKGSAATIDGWSSDTARTGAETKK